MTQAHDMRPAGGNLAMPAGTIGKAGIRSNGMARAALAVVAGWLCTAPVQAQPAPATAPTTASAPAPATDKAAGEPSSPPGLFDPSRTTLLGDIGGVRTMLGNLGVTFGIQDVNEVLGNVSGGTRRGADYDGVTLVSIGVDTDKAFGLKGGTFNISAFNIRGRNLSTDNLGTLETASGFEAAATTRLWEIWYQQAFLDDAFDVKVGQQSLDQEFMSSQGSALFINTSMGWPVLPSSDLYAGGPAYPLSSLGVRLRAQPGGGFTLLGGVFQDNPPGGPFNADGQLLGSTRWGGNFNLRTGALFIAEVQYAVNQPSPDQKDDAKQPGGLPGTYKLGFWYDTGSFPSPQFDTAGTSLASPLSNGMPRMVPDNFSLYAVADQVIWQPDPKGAWAVGVFARVMGAPNDRNLIDFSVDGGVTLKAPLPGRDADTLGLGFGVTKVSSAVRGFDSATAFFTGTNYPVRTSETFIELTYQIQVAPWWLLQPDFQYVVNPGGGLLNPNQPGKKIGNEAVLGLRSTVLF